MNDAKPKTTERDPEIARQVLRVRLAQMIINERYKNGDFKIPIHLAMGHEAIAVAVGAVMRDEDQLVLPHRNLHYNLARGPSLKAVIDEFLLNEEGLAGGALGSMNLCNEAAGIVYTSSILGNNLCVAAGVALANKVKKGPNVTIVVTGDGAIEEGAFYESLVFMRAQNLAVLVIVENNDWSMSTRIDERRGAIDLERFAEACGAHYRSLSGNDPYRYIEALKEARKEALAKQRPVIVEVALSTLGDWRLVNEDYPQGKPINYHAGPAPDVSLSEWPQQRESEDDPVFVLGGHFETAHLKEWAREALSRLQDEIR